MNANDAQLTAVFASRTAVGNNVEDNTPNTNTPQAASKTFEIIVKGVAGGSLAGSYTLSLVIHDRQTGTVVPAASLTPSPAPPYSGKFALNADGWTLVGPNYYLEQVFTVTLTTNAAAGHVLYPEATLVSDNFQVVTSVQGANFVLQAA